ncbi:signal peptidase II [Buchnera aphidicola]|uniref:signal peptidase II n=1 Tax=Buchnera aphidicola TaxID=9 RepID=UPI0034645104
MSKYVNLVLLYTIFILDYLTKVCIKNHFKVYESKFICYFINFIYIKNYGIAFNYFEGNSQYFKYILFIINIIIIIYIIKKYPVFNKNIGYILVLGGSLGNLFDRLYYGYVIDFIDIHIKNYHFAIFNISDLSIFIGMIIFLNFKHNIY